MLDALLSLGNDTVIFTHFIAINTAVGAAQGDDRVVCFWPDNGSVTRIRTYGNTLRLVQLGIETTTRIG